MPKLVLFLEERSAKEFLNGFLPKCLPEGWNFQLIAHEGKTDLEKSLRRKLPAWQEPDVKFMVMRDKDAGDCREVKQQLQEICTVAGKAETIIRIACYELEAWYFGNLERTGEALGINNLSKYSGKAAYRIVDDIVKPSDELDKITRQAYQKMSGSRAIGNSFEVDDVNTSHSFGVFVRSIRQLNN